MQRLKKRKLLAKKIPHEAGCKKICHQATAIVFLLIPITSPMIAPVIEVKTALTATSAIRAFIELIPCPMPYIIRSKLKDINNPTIKPIDAPAAADVAFDLLKI